MVQRPGHLFTKQEIFDAIWPDTAVTDHALTRVVAQLRRVLGDEAREARYLETVPTRGYRWIRPVEPYDPPHRSPRKLKPAKAAKAGRQRGPQRSASEPSRARAPLSRWRHRVACWRGATHAAGLGHRDCEQPSSDGMADARSEWPVQLTTHAGLDLQPALSPQGDAVAFVSDRTGALEIYVRGFGGGTGDAAHERRRPERAAGVVARRPLIAYHSYRPAASGSSPRAAARRGRSRRRVESGVVARRPADRLSIRRACRRRAQWVRRAERLDDLDGRRRRRQSRAQLTHSGDPIGGHAAPAWSSDGRYICVHASSKPDRERRLAADDRHAQDDAARPGRRALRIGVRAGQFGALCRRRRGVIMRLPFDAATGTLQRTARAHPGARRAGRARALDFGGRQRLASPVSR